MEFGDFELTDILSQECTLSQRPSEQFQANTSLHLVLFDVLLRVMSHNLYTIIPGVTLAFAFHHAYAEGLIHSQPLDHRFVPRSVCHRKRTEIPHMTCLAT